MATGKVKWFNDQKGYGFIEPEDGGKDGAKPQPEISRYYVRISQNGEAAKP